MADIVPAPGIGGSQRQHGEPEVVETSPSMPEPKLKGRKRLLQGLQRISSVPSLVRMGRMSSSGYRASGRGSISCVSLSLSDSPSFNHHDNSYLPQSSGSCSPAPSYALRSPVAEFPYADQAKGCPGIRIIESETNLGPKSPTTVPIPSDVRPTPKGTALEITPELSETAYDYFSKPVVQTRPSVRQDQDLLSSMPDEIQMEILQYLGPKEIVRCSVVSRSWHRKCFDGQLWASLDASDFYRVIPTESLTKIITSAGPFVRDLNLRGCLQLRDWAQAEALSNACRNLENVSLEGCQVEKASIHYLVLRNPNLVHLNLSGLTSVTNATCKIVGKYCKQLQFFNASWCYNMDAKGAVRVVDGCPKLKDLRINECRGFVDKSLMNRLFLTNNLERLVIHGCSDIQDEHFMVLFEGIDTEVCPITRRPIVPPRKLRHLDIGQIYDLTDKGFKSMCNNVPDLEGLQLGGCKELTDDAFTDFLPSVPKLTHLDLEEVTELSNESLQNLAKAPCAARLEHLSVSYCEEVGDTGMLAVVKACQNLKNLEIDNTRVSDLVLAEAAAMVRDRSRRCLSPTTSSSPSLTPNPPQVGLRLVVYDCQHVTWTGIREVLSRNAESTRLHAQSPSSSSDDPGAAAQLIQLKCFYGWQLTVDEHFKRLLVRNDASAASRLERKWAEYMMATEEAGAGGAGSRRRRRRAREAAMLHADEEDGGGAMPGVGGRRRRARSGGCTVM